MLVTGINNVQPIGPSSGTLAKLSRITLLLEATSCGIVQCDGPAHKAKMPER